MNLAAFETALTAHSMLASKNSDFVWEVLDANGKRLGEIFDGFHKLEVRVSRTPVSSRPAIRALIKTYQEAR